MRTKRSRNKAWRHAFVYQRRTACCAPQGLRVLKCDVQDCLYVGGRLPWVRRALPWQEANPTPVMVQQVKKATTCKATRGTDSNPRICARGGEAHRTEAAARHHGRSKCIQKNYGSAVVNQKTVDNCESFGAVRQAAASSTTKKSTIQGAYRVRVKGELSQDLAGAHSVLPKLSHRLVKG